VTPRGLGGARRLVQATVVARSVSRRAVGTALTGNVLGALLAAVGSERYGQRKATAPGKTASIVALAVGIGTAVRFDRRRPPAPSVHTPWHALDADAVLRRLADLSPEPGRRQRRRAAPPPARGPRSAAPPPAGPRGPPAGRTGAAPLRPHGCCRTVRPADAHPRHRGSGHRDAGRVDRRGPRGQVGDGQGADQRGATPG